MLDHWTILVWGSVLGIPFALGLGAWLWKRLHRSEVDTRYLIGYGNWQMARKEDIDLHRRHH